MAWRVLQISKSNRLQKRWRLPFHDNSVFSYCFLFIGIWKRKKFLKKYRIFRRNVPTGPDERKPSERSLRFPIKIARKLLFHFLQLLSNRNYREFWSNGKHLWSGSLCCLRLLWLVRVIILVLGNCSCSSCCHFFSLYFIIFVFYQFVFYHERVRSCPFPITCKMFCCDFHLLLLNIIRHLGSHQSIHLARECSLVWSKFSLLAWQCSRSMRQGFFDFLLS